MIILLFIFVSLFSQVEEPTTVIQRYYCIAGEQPASGGSWFLAGSIIISAQPFELWCEPVY